MLEQKPSILLVQVNTNIAEAHLQTDQVILFLKDTRNNKVKKAQVQIKYILNNFSIILNINIVNKRKAQVTVYLKLKDRLYIQNAIVQDQGHITILCHS
jgi:hypothetical protein